jgi:hypothetical protein
MGGNVQLLLSESEGRVRVPIGGLPSGVMAVTVPVRKGGVVRLPGDRHHRLRIDEVDLIADVPTDAFDPPGGLPTRDLVFVLEAGRRDWATIEKFIGRERAWEVVPLENRIRPVTCRS